MSSAQLGCGDRYILVDRRRRAEGSDGLVSAGFEFVTSAACSADEDFGQYRRWRHELCMGLPMVAHNTTGRLMESIL